MPRVFSSQIEDAQQPASNQTGEGGDTENSSADEGPDDGAESGSGAGSDAEHASGDDAGSDDQLHESSSKIRRRTILILFAIPLLHRIFGKRRELKERMRWDRSDSSCADIYGLFRYELQELNKQAGIHFICRHAYRKQGDL